MITIYFVQTWHKCHEIVSWWWQNLLKKSLYKQKMYNLLIYSHNFFKNRWVPPNRRLIECSTGYWVVDTILRGVRLLYWGPLSALCLWQKAHSVSEGIVHQESLQTELVYDRERNLSATEWTPVQHRIKLKQSYNHVTKIKVWPVTLCFKTNEDLINGVRFCLGS